MSIDIACRLPPGDLICIFPPQHPTASLKPCTEGAQAQARASHLSPFVPGAGGEALWPWQPALGPHSSGHHSHLLPWGLFPRPPCPTTQAVVPRGVRRLSAWRGSSRDCAGAAVMSRSAILSNGERQKVNPQVFQSSACPCSVSNAG